MRAAAALLLTRPVGIAFTDPGKQIEETHRGFPVSEWEALLRVAVGLAPRFNSLRGENLWATAENAFQDLPP